MRTRAIGILGVAAVVVFVGVAGLPSPARATAEDDARATAKAKLVEGGDLLKQGEYAAALGRFQEAYELVRSPKIQYNFGLAYMGLGRKADAADAFEKFLAEATDANPDLRANAERHRSTLGQQVGTLVVECAVNGAEVSVDGRSRGVTPLAAPIRLDPGPHQLIVEKEGAPPFVEKLSVVAGKRLTLEARLSTAAAPLANREPALVAPPPAVAVPAPPPASPEPSPAERKRALERKGGWGAGALAVVGLGFGIVERLSANGKFRDFNAQTSTYGKCDADDRVRQHGGPACDDLLSSGRSAATASLVGFIGAGVLGATSGALLWFTRPGRGEVSGRETAPGAIAASLSCAPDLARAGLLCAARF